MQCITCHRELDGVSGRCESCFAPESGLPSEADGPDAVVTRRSGRNEILAQVSVLASALVVMAWAGFVTYYLYEQVSAEAFGFWLGTLFIPFLVSYLVAGVRKRRNPLRFSICLLAIGIVLPSFSLQSKRPKLSNAELIREFVGNGPLDRNLPENEKTEIGVARAYFDDLRQFNLSYSERGAKLASQLASLYSAESFAGRKSIESAVVAVQQKLALDQEVVEKLNDALGSVRARLDKTSLSESDKQEFMKGFQTSFADSDIYRARKEMMKPETDWVNATANLYQFSLHHLTELSVTGNTIHIASETTRSQFNAKLSESKELAAAYRAAAKRFNGVREASMKNAGIAASDLGLKK